MKITIGRMLCIALLFASQHLFAHTVSLTAHTMDGASLEIAGVGKPFIVDVVVENSSGSVEAPIWRTTQQQISLHNSGYQMSSINGVTNVTYQYRVRIDQPGDFVLGPVTVGSVTSSTLSITVADTEKARGVKAQKAKKDAHVFMRFSINKHKAVVGERLKATVRLYSTISINVTLIEPDAQECADVKLYKKSDAVTGTEMIDGVEHHYVQWLFDVYPQKAGSCVIPAFAADYNPPVHSSFFNPFAFMSTMQGPKRVYSNGLTLSITPLPAGVSTDTPIGHFTHFDVTLDRTSAHVGDGLVLTMTLLGDGDWQTLKAPALSLPSSIKWYESKQSVHNAQGDHEKKTFEYIVQPLESGTFTIPAQQFTYYDVIDHSVRTLKTSPISLAVIRTASSASAESHHEQEEKEEHQILQQVPKTIALIAEYHAHEPWHAIPFVWFIFVVVVLTGFITGGLAINGWNSINATRQTSRHRLLASASKQVQRAHEKHDYRAIYALFMQLFAQLLHKSEQQLSSQEIEHFLQEKGCSAYVIEQWRIFIDQLSECAYYDAHDASLRYPDLGARALAWIGTLKEVL